MAKASVAAFDCDLSWSPGNAGKKGEAPLEHCGSACSSRNQSDGILLGRSRRCIRDVDGGGCTSGEDNHDIKQVQPSHPRLPMAEQCQDGETHSHSTRHVVCTVRRPTSKANFIDASRKHYARRKACNPSQPGRRRLQPAFRRRSHVA